MPHFNELTTILNRHFKWNKARMDCFVGMLIALFYSKTSNLAQLAAAFPGTKKTDSNYRRIQRFLSSGQVIEFNKVAWFIMGLFGFLTTDYYLVFDRTNWQWGKKNINILVLAVVYRGIAVPIYWLLLNRQF